MGGVGSYGPVVNADASPQCCPCQQGAAGPAGPPGEDGPHGNDGAPGAPGKHGNVSGYRNLSILLLLLSPCLSQPKKNNLMMLSKQ